MRINIPQKFPQWFSGQITQYTPDIIRTRNVRIKELSTTGEIDVKNYLSLLNSTTSLVSSIFDDPNHLLSFATKNGVYYIDNLQNPVVSTYTPDPLNSYPLEQQGTGVCIYPRGYSRRDVGAAINSSGSVATANLTTFVDVPERSRTYAYTEGQKVLAVKFQFYYTQNTGTNIIRFIITDTNGDHIVKTETAHSGGRTWSYWIRDGENGCNLNLPSGFTAKVQVATSSSTDYVYFYNTSSDHIDFMLEMGNTQLLTVGSSGILMRYNDSTTDTYRLWYPGSSIAWDSVFFGYPQYSSIFQYKYPVIMKMFNDKILLIGNANSLHTVDITGGVDTADTDAYTNVLSLTLGTFTTNRLVLPSNYIIKWIEVSHDTVYIGATQYIKPFNEIGRSVVLLWQPSTDRQEMYDVPDGENVGKALNSFLYILTSKGNIQILYNGQFQTLAKIYQTSENYNIQLPHINGVAVYQDSIAFLLPGNKYVPAGIYIFDTATKQVYHKHSIYYSTTSKLDYGGNQPQVITGALKYTNNNGEDIFFAGVDNVIKEDGTFTGGIFDTKNIKANPISSYGYIETARIKTQEITEFVNGLGLKFRGIGNIVISEKKQETLNSFVDGIYTGNWGTNITDPSSFTVTFVPPLMKKGDRITVLDGTLRGFSTTVKNITGTTITIDPPSKYSLWNNITVSGAFSFLLETFGYSGTLTNSTTLSVSSSIASVLSVGDELEFIAGLGAGIVNYITAINSTNITLKNPMPYVSGNWTVFIVDKYKYIDTVSNLGDDTWKVINASNEPLDSDFIQYKFILSDNIKIRDIQTNVKPNQIISDDAR